MNHYCTYFDSNYLVPGVALWQSLQRYDPGMVLWVLALDEATATALTALRADDLRVLTPEELERADPELARSRATRSALEHLFTFSPCLPRHILRQHPEVAALTYVDADICFFASAEAMHREWAIGSIFVTPHNLPLRWSPRNEKYGYYNVGILGFRNDSAAWACLDWWRERCLEWCKDTPEPGRFADQKYLDEWPERFSGVVISENPALNVAPWNWSERALAVSGGAPMADGQPLVAFHFAQLRRLSARCIDTNQARYGVIPCHLRAPIYGRYVAALDRAAEQLAVAGYAMTTALRPRSQSGFRRWMYGIVFGTVWFHIGGMWCSGGFGMGRHSGWVLARLRRWRGKED